MTDDDGRISRRRVLGALGGIGTAGAFGGGTSALLWDEEGFGSAELPNVLAAGNLNLQVDWTEHYSDWKGSETAVDGVRMVESADDVGGDEVGLPVPEDPMLAVAAEDTDGDGTAQIDEFMAETIIEESDLTDDPDPVVMLADVKPGDFGEVTLSYHLEGNPGYVSLCSEVVANDDNGSTEPELAAGDDPDDPEDDMDGELGEHLQAMAWYDPDCNNRFGGGEVEVMLVTDVSESMAGEFPGTPNEIDGDSGDGSRLEAIKGILGDYNGGGFLGALADSCSDGVEIGTVSTSEDLHHLDNLDDGDDADDPAGFDDGGLGANLDKALGAVGGTDYDDLGKLYGTGTDSSPDFVTDDPLNNGADINGDGTPDEYEAERPYVENGSSRQTMGVRRAHRALLPDGLTAPSGREGIDPSGNAAAPGETRKIMVVFLDSEFSDVEDPSDTADTLSTRAEQDDVEILPVVVNSNPSTNTVNFADSLSTDGVDPVFATEYEGTPSTCDGDISGAGFDCQSLDAAMASVRAEICSSAGAERRIAGPASIDTVLDGLSDCQLLAPTASGATPAAEFDSPCHEAGSGGCVALAWWLPRDIPGVNDNVVQSDSYRFTIGFEAEQCRHNGTETTTETAEGV